jgi:tetraacyldisaccharide 4'-kinase
VSRSARPWLVPLAPLYRLALGARNVGLRAGLSPIQRLRSPVISIGSLSAGGAGKTPLTLALAHALAQRGFGVDILSRGYGRSSAKPAHVDPAGTADDFGDEPLLLAQTGFPVYVAAQRYQAGLLAERESDSHRIHLLDDGFQHRQLHRDVNIALFSHHDRDDRLLPAGNLREPLSALRRASILAVPAQELDLTDANLAEELRWKGAVWRLRRHMVIPEISGPVLAFCGIARADQFFLGLEASGVELVARIAFPDHHRYIPADVARLVAAARATHATAFLTTEKDRMRLGPLNPHVRKKLPLAAQLAETLPLATAALHIEIVDEDSAIAALLAMLARA